jgi:hypothetical protein
MRTLASLRSNFFADRPRAALWIAAAIGAVALVVATVVGFNSKPKENPNAGRRTAVAQYIVRVGRIQIAMAQKIRAVDRSYRKFAKEPQTLASRVAEYDRAEATLTQLRDRLAGVLPPPDAKRLHRLLLRLADANIEMAGAVTGLASYLPTLARTQAPLTGAVRTLQAKVRAAKTASAQAVAFGEYSEAAAEIAAKVAKLEAPALFTDARDAEAKQLRRLSTLASDIGASLRQKQLERAQTLVAELAQAQTETTVVRAQRAAALAYNAKLQAIQDTAKAIEKERRRLERRVPTS